MPTKIIMPQGGQDLNTGKVVRWLKKEGEAVNEGDIVCEVETEKAVFEVSAPVSGYLIKILAQDGDEVEILSTIGYVGLKDEKIDEKKEPENFNDNEGVLHKSASENAREAFTPTEGGFIKISPKARLLARQHGLDIKKLISSRDDGKITYEDVSQTLDNTRRTDYLETLPPYAKIVKTGRMRRTIAQRMSQSWTSAPHIFVTLAVNMTEALRYKQEHFEQGLTLTDLVIAACARAIRKFDEINSSFIDEDIMYIWEEINIGLALSLDDGLVVVVVEDADRLSLKEISARRKIVVESARQGKMVTTKPSHFTISNLGMHNVDQFTAILNPPEAAILAVSSIRRLPGFDENGEVVACDMMNMTLSLDHRVGDGVLAARFVNEIKRLLENPYELQ